jgi:KilA-N domain
MGLETRRVSIALSSQPSAGSNPPRPSVSSLGPVGTAEPTPTRIAFEFASWVSVEFKLYLIKEFQRLKEDENRRLSLAWDLNRTLSKLNYRIHTDAVKANLIPAVVSAAQAASTYASEADLLNVALYGQAAKQWRDANLSLDGNLNAELIQMGLPRGERLQRLNTVAIRQMRSLTGSPALVRLASACKH